MKSIRTSKEILKEWVEANMDTHTDWTGTRVETKHKCNSIDEFIDKIYEYLEDNHYRC
jgi:cobalamin biosynthesis Mg chelatase CobN